MSIPALMGSRDIHDKRITEIVNEKPNIDENNSLTAWDLLFENKPIDDRASKAKKEAIPTGLKMKAMQEQLPANTRYLSFEFFKYSNIRLKDRISKRHIANSGLFPKSK